MDRLRKRQGENSRLALGGNEVVSQREDDQRHDGEDDGREVEGARRLMRGVGDVLAFEIAPLRPSRDEKAIGPKVALADREPAESRRDERGFAVAAEIGGRRGKFADRLEHLRV